VIIGTPALNVTFDAAVTYATRIVAELQSFTEVTPRNASQVQTQPQGSGRGRGGRNGGRGGGQ
jgi:isopentenyl diphosphate isomerase/L-lactate dehydrogenase-like FMN-dependent dehydrogenase